MRDLQKWVRKLYEEFAKVGGKLNERFAKIGGKLDEGFAKRGGGWMRDLQRRQE